jgi:AraC-like DNA-binding protein
MTVEHFLIAQKMTLPASGEWVPQCTGWIMVRIAEGSGYCLQKGNASDLNAGDGFILPATSNVVVRASQLNMLLLQFVKIQPEFLNGLLTVTERLRLEALQRNSACIFLFKANELIGQKFKRLVEPAGNHSLSNRCALLQLWAHCVDGLLTAIVPETKNENRLLQRIRELVGQMPEIELFRYSSADLASQLYCSERHFSRLFRAEFGVPFRSHQIALRLQHACQLLKDPGKKILNIANESGYQNTGLFNAMFKRRFGVTPTEWRRRNSIPPFRLPRSESENLPPASGENSVGRERSAKTAGSALARRQGEVRASP